MVLHLIRFESKSARDSACKKTRKVLDDFFALFASETDMITNYSAIDLKRILPRMRMEELGTGQSDVELGNNQINLVFNTCVGLKRKDEGRC